MKTMLYVVSVRGEWKAYISLDIRMDILWWTGRLDQSGFRRLETTKAERMVLLSAAVPLGHAVAWRDQFKHQEHYHKFTAGDWDKLLNHWWDEQQRRISFYSKGSAAGSGNLHSDGWDRRVKRKGRPVEEWPMMEASMKAGNSARREEIWMAHGEGSGSQALGGSVLLYDHVQGITLESRAFLESSTNGLGGVEEKGLAGLHKLPVPSELERFKTALAGRSLLLPELHNLLAEELPQLSGSWRTAVQLAHLQGSLALLSGVARVAGGRKGLAGRLRGPAAPRCRRCGSVALRTAPCASCGQSSCAYCEACLALGRSRECALLLRGSSGEGAAGHAAAARNRPFTGQELDRWGLSPAQREAAAAALQFLVAPQVPAPPSASRLLASRLFTPFRKLLPVAHRGLAPNRASSVQIFRLAAPKVEVPSASPARFLLWAVTGAGKTEMIFPLLAAVLEQGGRALVATPRRDVVLELAPRVAKAFPDQPMSVLYGGSAQRWQTAGLVLATTHQLLRFHKAFDLVIIDELDAFPFHNDKMLAFAAEQCCKKEGHFIFLSATPPRHLLKEAAAGRCGLAKVPARFHGFPLPVPKRLTSPSLADCISRKKLPAALLSELGNSINRGAQIFLFVSKIKHIQPLVRLLRANLPGIAVEGTSSQDADRTTKVLDFRDGSIRLLITTTILERGVTVPRSDVFILDADSGLFDEASLVQMAGRAGRSKEDPAGKVLFFSSGSNWSQIRAIRQIREMNRVAEKKGFIRHSNLKGVRGK